MQLSRSAGICVITLYWSTVLLGSLLLVFSMVSTLWGPRVPSTRASLGERQTFCVGQLALLHAELQHQTQAALRFEDKISDVRAKQRVQWQRSWTERLDGITNQCRKPASLHEALEQLAELQQRYEAIVIAWQRAEDGLRTPIDNTLRQLVDPLATQIDKPANTP